MKTFSKKLFSKLIIVLTIGILSACSQEKDSMGEINSGEARLKVSLETVLDNEDAIPVGNGAKSAIATSNALNGVVSLTESMQVEYSLDQTNNQKLPQLIKTANAAPEIKAAINRKTLTKGTYYALLVYDEQENYLEERLYNYGSESNLPPLLLNAGKAYTFVAFSINTSNSLPTVLDKAKLSTLKLSKVSGDLMIFKKKLTLTYGENLLSVVLKHRYSSITTQLSVDANTVGAFQALTNAAISPVYESANYDFAQDAFEYVTVKTGGCPVTFPSFQTGQRTVTSNPSIMISPLTNTASLNFGIISIDDETKKNLVIPNVKITPGVSYTLKLNFKTCTQPVGQVEGLDWRYPAATWLGKLGIWKDGVFYSAGSTITRNITAPGADYGFVFDITELDNAFNMELNGVKLAQKEIQFERGAASPQNIRFKDQSMYQGVNTETGGNIDAVYNMKGTSTAPLVKVVIGKNGEVRLFGSKVSGGPLYELELFGNAFNTFKWNTPGQGVNSIKVTQLVDGRTILVGTGSGKKKVACT